MKIGLRQRFIQRIARKKHETIKFSSISFDAPDFAKQSGVVTIGWEIYARIWKYIFARCLCTNLAMASR